MAVQILINGKKVGRDFERGMKRNAELVRANIQQTVEETCSQIEFRGRQDIRSAGKFGPRWTEGFTATPKRSGNNVLRIEVREVVPYWTVFQTGKVIHGRPMLWIPLSFAVEAKGISARNYPGKLFRVDRSKRGLSPLLMAKGGRAVYFGRTSVTISKKFHLVEIARDIANKMPVLYRQIAERNKAVI
jgi:hypothetical protein